ncbi:MAG TPA: hypothetical protein VKI17_07040 [Gemmataceae bacterium]|nr:hypothetical protein [Gemmataceae bacterium]
MANVQTETPAVSAPPRRRPLFLAGILIFLLGIGLYFIQLRMRSFMVPWYVPVLATVGVALMALSLRQRRGILRIGTLILFVALCGFEWFFLLVVTKLPAFTGPAQPGARLPVFAATLADGTSFTNADLQKGTSSVLVFYRGHW